MKACFVIFAALMLTHCADGARTRPVGGNGMTQPPPPNDNNGGGGSGLGGEGNTTQPSKENTESAAQNEEANAELCPHKDETMCKIWETLKGTGEGFYEKNTTTSSSSSSTGTQTPR